MRKGLRRDYHRKAIKLMRAANKSVREDERLNGRFVLIAVDEDWTFFEDKSGGLLRLTVRVYDRKHDEYKDYLWEYAPYFKTNEWDLCMGILNDFACHQVEVHCELDFKDDKSKKIDINEISKRERKYWYV